MMSKRRFILILLALFVLHILFIYLPIILNPGSVGGNFGIRPRTHKCMGIVISNEKALNTFPRGDITFNLLGKGYEYRVNEDRMLHDVCIGQDVWYGE